MWREYRGLSVKALAASAGLSQSYLTQIETGKRTGTAASLENISRELDVELETCWDERVAAHEFLSRESAEG